MDRHTFPNGGWQFYQPQTGWHAPAPVSFTFDQIVIEIIKHRKANPAVTAKFKLATEFNAVATELETFTAKRLGLPDPKLIPPPMQPQLSGAVVAAVDKIKKLASGNALLLEWQESGIPPVDSALANSRAAVCAACPKNDPGGLLKYFSGPVSETVRKRLAKLHDMNLTTPSDAALHVCSACLCPLRLKVHTPMSLILGRLKPEQRAELDPKCWILSESK